MSRRRTIALLVVVLVQLAVPLGLAGLAAADLAFGQEIRLEAQPVDPVDIFRGNYVALRYEISSVPVAFAVGRGDRVCVSLVDAGDDTWHAGPAHAELPEGDDAICGHSRTDAPDGGEVEIEYGIETYFASEDRAKELEQSISRGQLIVVIDLDEDGSARIERLEIEPVDG